jgi:hypothetical protein
VYYPCPVCGYGQMSGPPENYNICPSCGTEFGYDDLSKSHRQLRNKWLASGAKWFSFATPPPDFYWNGFLQVTEAGLPYDAAMPRSFQEISIPVAGVDIPEILLSKSLECQNS